MTRKFNIRLAAIAPQEGNGRRSLELLPCPKCQKHHSRLNGTTNAGGPVVSLTLPVCWKDGDGVTALLNANGIESPLDFLARYIEAADRLESEQDVRAGALMLVGFMEANDYYGRQDVRDMCQRLLAEVVFPTDKAVA